MRHRLLTLRRKRGELAPLVTDNFADGDDTEARSGLTPLSDDGAFQNVVCLGHQREAYVQKVSGSNRGSINFGPSLLSFNQGSLNLSWGRVVWDGADDDPYTIATTGLGGIDVSKYTAISVFIAITDITFDGLALHVYSGALHASASVPSATTGEKIIPLASFAGDDVWGAVGAIELRFNPTVSGKSISITEIKFI